jgi:hypothetical protein
MEAKVESYMEKLKEVCSISAERVHVRNTAHTCNNHIKYYYYNYIIIINHNAIVFWSITCTKCMCTQCT